MRALSIDQPHALAICRGLKRIENRTRPISYRGPIAIHATQSSRRLELEADGRHERLYGLAGLEFGAVLGVCWVIGCFSFTELHEGGPPPSGLEWLRGRLDRGEATGPWCWILAMGRQIRPAQPVRGRQGLWTWDPPAGWLAEID